MIIRTFIRSERSLEDILARVQDMTHGVIISYKVIGENVMTFVIDEPIDETFECVECEKTYSITHISEDLKRCEFCAYDATAED